MMLPIPDREAPRRRRGRSLESLVWRLLVAAWWVLVGARAAADGHPVGGVAALVVALLVVSIRWEAPAK